MGANDLIGRLVLAGVRLSLLSPDRLAADPRDALTDELRQLIRDNKQQLIEALAPVAGGTELRRRRVLAELERHPQAQRWAIFDPDAHAAYVICTIAIRDIGTCELRIPRDKYNPWAVLEALQTTQ